MGYARLWRRKKILPGVTLNLSKSGLSASFGVRGMHYTVGHGRRRSTVGIPGTGVYYTTYSHAHAHRAARSHAVAQTTWSPPAGRTSRSGAFSTPRRKIVWGWIYTALIITAPIGIPLLIVGIRQKHAQERVANLPLNRQRALIAQAQQAPTPEQFKELLDQAWAVLPESPQILAAFADWHYHARSWSTAADLYRRYLVAAPNDWEARAHLAQALLWAGCFSAAVPVLQEMLTAPLAEDSRVSMTRNLALALCAVDEADRGLEVVRTLPLQRHTLSPELIKALHARAVCYALTGQRARAVHDLDRLYALEPTYPDLDSDRTAMKDGTFRLTLVGPDDHPIRPASGVPTPVAEG